MPHKVGPKGQIVIAKDIRDQLGLEPGWLAFQRLVDDHVEVYFLPPEHRRSLKGSLAAHIQRRPAPDLSWEDVREQAWRSSVSDRPDGQESAL
ncbi:MAG: looped-hinge helix binding domain, AbrB family [Dehalococcoidia bacterium]|nr:looped-hinge helix binding domain, AbrB family [Dehalococcoidia bacterium]